MSNVLHVIVLHYSVGSLLESCLRQIIEPLGDIFLTVHVIYAKLLKTLVCNHFDYCEKL